MACISWEQVALFSASCRALDVSCNEGRMDLHRWKKVIAGYAGSHGRLAQWQVLMNEKCHEAPYP